jgi:UDP-N-acetylmuramoyl-L-alanyl-D-glutamate--2,6-diaminopimelate ligase
MSQILADITKDLLVKTTIGNVNLPIERLSFDSRVVDSGTVFFAIKGTQTDGHHYIEQVIEKGCKCIVCENLPETIPENITILQVENSNEALGLIATAFYGYPSKNVHLVGVTGTNGKTTIVTLLYKLFRDLGYKVGLISTVVNKINDLELPATHTTPDAVQLNQLLRQMADAGCEYVFMEVSSHAVAQSRITGLVFKGGVFTNLTHDHLDFHGNFMNYVYAKKGFFDQLPATAFALTNSDDRNGMVMLQNTKATKKTYALTVLADYHCHVIENHFDGLLLRINGLETWFRLVGNFNAYNLTAIYGTALLLGQESEKVLLALSNLSAVDGRFDYIRNQDGIIGVVDYAHTPDAVENVIDTINALRDGSRRLITVIGAGGDRDRTKRPIMAAIASAKSQLVILTSDNPRSENPEAILAQMEAGINPANKSKVLTIQNRREAIRTAGKLAQPGDIILVAGKGHEKYQEINGVRHHFDDKEELMQALNIKD